METVGSSVAIPWWGDRLSLKVSVRITLTEKGDTAESIEERLIAAGELAAAGVKGAGA